MLGPKRTKAVYACNLRSVENAFTGVKMLYFNERLQLL